jgi:hypothetical protein
MGSKAGWECDESLCISFTRPPARQLSVPITGGWGIWGEGVEQQPIINSHSHLQIYISFFPFFRCISKMTWNHTGSPVWHKLTWDCKWVADGGYAGYLVGGLDGQVVRNQPS